MLALMAFTTSVLLIPGQKYDTLTTSDSGWVYDTAFEINRTNALAENNPLSHAPYGLTISPGEQFQPLVTVMLYRGLRAISGVELMDVVKYWAPFIFALSLIPIFLIGKEFGGDVGGITAAFFAATMVSTIYWNKVGAYDREPVQLILGAWAMYLTIKLFRAPKSSIPKFALLTGMVYGLFGLAWGGWHYIIAVTILGLLLVLLVGFLGKFIRKTSDISGAFLSAIRGHLDLLIGIAGMAVVITLVMWAFGGQDPSFWIGIFRTYAGYLGIGAGGGVSFSAYATEMQSPGSWGDVISGFYNTGLLTAFILILVILAFTKFCWSRKRWELLTFAWLIVLMAMVFPGKGQARFERLWWPFVPALAGVGVATLVSLVQRFSLDPSGEWLKHLQNPIALLLVGGIIAAPFIANTYTTAYQTTPPTEWHSSGLDQGFMEAFAWLRDPNNTPDNSVVSIQWSFGHLLTGAARRPTVCDGAEIRAEEGKWENDPSFVPRPPDYIYRVEGNYAYIYGMDIPRRPFEINGRRIDVQWFPLIGENEFEWYMKTYRDNYGVKIDHVVFSYDEYYQALNYYTYTQPRDILLSAERLFTPSELRPTMEGSYYVFNFGENRENVWLHSNTLYAYLRTGDETLFLDGCGFLRVDAMGRIGNLITFIPPPVTANVKETLIVFLNESGSVVTAWLVKGVSGEIERRPVPMGVNVFQDGTQDIEYLRVAFTSSNGMVKILGINHAPYLISPTASVKVNDNTPDFRWGAINARYELLVDDDSSFSSPLIHEDNITSTMYTATVALQDGDYYWKVAAYDSRNNLLGWSDPSTFTVDTQAPSRPQLSGPQDGAELSTLDATFRWTEPEQGVTYDIQIDDENSFATPYVHENTGLTDTSYAYTFERNGTYYWHVRAKDDAGNAGEWSNTFALTIRAPPQAPALSSPKNGVFANDNTPTLEWTGGNGDNYHLLLSTDPGLSSPTLDILLASSVTSYTIPEENALPDGGYYWKVAAVVGSDENSSDIWTFIVDTVPPESPVLHAPENGTETGDNTPTFEWSLSLGADNYHLVVDSDIAFGSPDIDIWLVESTYTPTTELSADNYFWKVTAKDAAGNESASSIWTFEVVSSGG
jgi:hypothetical protein